MIVETGFLVDENDPESKPSQYKLGAFTESGYPTVIMDAFQDWSE